MDPDDAAQPGGQPARRRGHVSRRRFTPWTVGVVVAALLAGGLFALSARTSGGTPLRADRADQVVLVQRARAQNEQARRRVTDLQQEIAGRTRQFAGVNSTVADLQQRLDTLAPLAGFEPVRGPVLEVRLDDAPRGQSLPAGIPPDYLVVHQQDVQAVVNALWRGGAEAMMLMDQRVVSTSAVRCVGNTLILQGRVYSPPYRIRAIGDPARLRAALASSPEVAIYRQFVQLVNLRYDVIDRGVQTFPKFDGPTALTFATPDAPGDDPSGTSSGDASGTPSSSGASGTGRGTASGSVRTP